MKTFAKVALVCLFSTLVSAQEYSISFDKIETHNEFIPAISFLIKPKYLQKLNFILAYANDFSITNNNVLPDRPITSYYMAIAYRF
ncbi:MAG: hypothetical protein QM497_03210 [Sulfurimonas sp.]